MRTAFYLSLIVFLVSCVQGPPKNNDSIQEKEASSPNMLNIDTSKIKGFFPSSETICCAGTVSSFVNDTTLLVLFCDLSSFEIGKLTRLNLANNDSMSLQLHSWKESEAASIALNLCTDIFDNRPQSTKPDTCMLTDGIVTILKQDKCSAEVFIEANTKQCLNVIPSGRLSTIIRSKSICEIQG